MIIIIYIIDDVDDVYVYFIRAMHCSLQMTNIICSITAMHCVLLMTYIRTMDLLE